MSVFGYIKYKTNSNFGYEIIEPVDSIMCLWSLACYLKHIFWFIVNFIYICVTEKQ